jgi:hypothetical protein
VRVTGSFLRRSCSTSKGNDYVYSLGGIIITMKEDIQLGKGMIMSGKILNEYNLAKNTLNVVSGKFE